MRLYDRAPMAARKVFRWLAPLALVAVIAAVYLVVHKTLAPKHKIQATTTSHQVVHPGTRKAGRRRRPTRRFYVVKPGDSLSSIAVKMRLSVASLERFNANVNPNSLQTGQRLALQP
jgi:spore germination protein YaaH